MSLLDKLKEHFKSPCHNRSSKIAKKLCALVLATGMTIAPMALSACNCSTPNPDAGTNPPIVNPDNGGADIGGNTGNGNNQTPGNNNGGSSNENDYSQYSQLLQNVLNDEYYNNLIDAAESDPSLFDQGYFGPHPFAFYQNEGYNVYDIRTGKIKCRTYSYILDEEPNSLYMSTRLTFENAPVPYHTQYMLKYTLTDQEASEYQMLFGDGFMVDDYIQAAFINDKISATKNVQILSKTKIAVQTHKNLVKLLEDTEMGYYLLKKNTFDIALKCYDEENDTFELYTYPTNLAAVTYRDVKVGIFLLKSHDVYSVKTNEDGIFIQPGYTYSDCFIEQDGFNYKNAAKTAICYDAESIDFSTSKSLIKAHEKTS